jgi:hypothetical protein
MPWRLMGSGGMASPSFTSQYMELSSQLHVPAALPPGNNPGTQWMGCWRCPSAVLMLWSTEHLHNCQESNSSLQPEARRYIDWAISTHVTYIYIYVCVCVCVCVKGHTERLGSDCEVSAVCISLTTVSVYKIKAIERAVDWKYSCHLHSICFYEDNQYIVRRTSYVSCL